MQIRTKVQQTHNAKDYEDSSCIDNRDNEDKDQGSSEGQQIIN